MTRLLVAITLAKYVSDGISTAAPAIAEFTPLANLGLGGVIFWIWMQERKERRERQTEDDKRYAALLDQFLEALSTRIECPMRENGAAKPRLVNKGE